MRTVLIEASPWNPATGAVSPVALAGGGVRPYLHRGRSDWLAGVVAEPKFSARIEFNENGFSGGALPEFGALEFAPSSAARLASISGLLWNGAAIEVFVGDDERLGGAVWSTLIKGTVEAQSVRGGSLVLKVRDASGSLDTPVAPNRFAGTGGIEGDAFAAGRMKRRAFGYLSNIEALPLKAASNVYELADPAFPLSQIFDVRDIGRAASSLVGVGWQGSVAATLAALEAQAAPKGGGVVAPSIACVKWWTQPVGPLTADVLGTLGSNGGTAPARLAEVVVSSRSALTISNTTEAESWRLYATGVFVDNESETVAQVLDRLLKGVSLAWNANADGTIRLSSFSFANPVETLKAVDASRTQAFKPLTRRRLGFLRNHREHAESEIASALRDDAGALLTAGAAFGSTLFRSDGTTIASQPDFETSAGTALAIAGQAATATSSDFAAVTGATKPANNATVGAEVGTNVIRPGGTIYTVAQLETSLGTALAILGQGSFATVNQANLDDAALISLPFRFQAIDGDYLRADRMRYPANGLSIADLRPAEFGSNVTENRTALGIVGQGAFATRNSVDYASGLLTGFRYMATRDYSAIGVDVLFPSYGYLGEPGVVTALGTSLGIVGQAPAATDVTIESSADVTKTASGPGALELSYNGATLTDTLPKNAPGTYKLTPAGGSYLTNGVTWAVAIESGSFIGAGPSMSSSGGLGTLAVNSGLASATASLLVSATVNGKKYPPVRTVVSRNVATTTQGGATTAGSFASTSSFNAIGTSGSFQPLTEELTVNSGTTATLTAASLGLSISFQSGGGASEVYMKWQKLSGGSWVDVGGVATSSPSPSYSLGEPNDGSISVNATATGLTAGANTFRLVGYRSGPAQGISIYGQASAQG